MYAVGLVAAFLWSGQTPGKRPAAEIKLEETSDPQAFFAQKCMLRCLNPNPLHRPSAAVVSFQVQNFGPPPPPAPAAAPTPLSAEAQVDQDLLEKLREFDIEGAAGALARLGFKKLRTFQRMEDRHVDELGLPAGTALELKDLLESLRAAPTTPVAAASGAASTSGLPSVQVCSVLPSVLPL